MRDLDETQAAAQAQFARQSHRYAQGHVLENTEDVADATQYIELPQNARVLDVATGAGHTGLYFAALGHRVTLADVAAPMLERAMEAAQRRGIEIETRQHTAEEMPYADGTFHLVSCRVAAHHFSDPARFVREAARVLQPGGFFLLIDGTVEDEQPEAEQWLHQVEKLRDPSHVRLLTPARARELCEAAGLEVVRWMITQFQQPDLQWYFETAATSPENRVRVLELVHSAPVEARALFQLDTSGEKITWWWQRLTLIARKA
jgi:ubiquinone/menaquinone biosynthesis C-methylase UbiE